MKSGLITVSGVLLSLALASLALALSLEGMLVAPNGSAMVAGAQTGVFGEPTTTVVKLNMFYTLPVFSYNGQVGLVQLQGSMTTDDVSIEGNFTSTAYVYAPGSGLSTIKAKGMPLAVYPTPVGVYLLQLNSSYFYFYSQNVSKNEVTEFTPVETQLVYLGGQGSKVIASGNISGVLPTNNGVVFMEVVNNKSYLVEVKGSQVVSNISLPSPAFPVYSNGKFVLLSSSYLTLNGFEGMNVTRLPEEALPFLRSVMGVPKFYAAYPNGTVKPLDVSLPRYPDATYFVMPQNYLGASVGVIAHNFTLIYAFNGTKLLLIANLSNPSTLYLLDLNFPLPYAVFGNGVAYVSFTALKFNFGSTSDVISLSSTVTGYYVSGDRAVQYYQEKIDGLPLALVPGDASSWMFYIKPSVSVGMPSPREYVMSIATNYGQLKVPGPSNSSLAIQVQVSTQTVSGQKVLVVQWKPVQGVTANVTVYVSVDGGPFKAISAPMQARVVYFPLPNNATSATVYAVVASPVGLYVTPKTSLSLASPSTTTQTYTTTTMSTTSSNVNTTTFTTTHSTGSSVSSSSPTTSGSPLAGQLGTIGLVAAVVVVLGILAFILLRK
jgi:hypothetical protein